MRGSKGRTDTKNPTYDIVNKNLKQTNVESIDTAALSPESQEDLKKYIELLKIKLNI